MRENKLSSNVMRNEIDATSYGTQVLLISRLFLLFTEIARVRASLFQINGVRKEPLQLPEAEGEPVTLNEKVYVPVKEHPDVSTRENFYCVLW